MNSPFTRHMEHAVLHHAADPAFIRNQTQLVLFWPDAHGTGPSAGMYTSTPPPLGESSDLRPLLRTADREQRGVLPAGARLESIQLKTLYPVLGSSRRPSPCHTPQLSSRRAAESGKADADRENAANGFLQRKIKRPPIPSHLVCPRARGLHLNYT